MPKGCPELSIGPARPRLEQTEQLYIERSARLREMREAQMHDSEGSAEAMFKVLSTEAMALRVV